MTSGSILGTRVQRIEDPALLRGRGTYIDGLPLEGALHVAYVRATVAHATITDLDVDGARAMPGVVDVVTADDLDLGAPAAHPLLHQAMGRPWLATGTVRFVGEPVAAVVAVTKAQAVDAAEAVYVDYEPRPVVVDPERALRDDVLLFPEAGTNVCLEEGELDERALDACEVVVRARILNPRMAAAPLEGRTAASVWHDGRLTHWSANQGAHGMRDSLMAALDIRSEDVRVIVPDVGGGFGAKQGDTPEELLVAWLARRLGRPVRWTETRTENMLGMVHGRGQVQYATIGGTRDGRMQVYRLDIVQESGAYASMGAVLPYMTRLMAPGVYDIPDVGVRIRSVVTNTTPVGAFRGAGRPEAAAAIERVVDVYATEIGLDPAEVRRRNFHAPESFPLRTATGGRYDSGEYAAVLEAALGAAGYDELRAEQAGLRASGDPRLLGIGVSSYVEITNVMRQSEYGSVEITSEGAAIVRTGSSSHGQGHHTAWAMLVSDRTGIPLERIEVRHGDTDDVPRGSGTGGSKSLQIGGAAAMGAAELVVEKAKALAAELLEASVEDIVHDRDAGTFGVAGTPVSARTWAELATLGAAATGADAADERGPLFAELDFQPEGSTFPFGAHVSVVEVDAETGGVTVLRHVACDDAGTILNPLIFDGQVHGGVAAGIGQALWEVVRYDADGNPLTANFADYGFPSAAELPSFERVPHETTTPMNPLGAKGVGEAGTIGATPAVHNAVVDALSHLGVHHVDMPLTAERVWRAIQSRGA